MFQRLDDRSRRLFRGQAQIHHAQIGPANQIAVPPFQFLMPFLRPHGERPVKRVTDHRRLPRKKPLRGVRRLAETESLMHEPFKKHRHVRRPAQIRFGHAAHRRRHAPGEQRPGPLPGGGAQGRRAERMQMVRERPGHEFDGGPRERAGNVLVIPAGVKRDLAHGKPRRKRRRRWYPPRFHSRAAGKLPTPARSQSSPSLYSPLVSPRRSKYARPHRPSVSAWMALSTRPARDRRGRAVQPCDHQQSVRGIQTGCVRAAIKGLAAGPASSMFPASNGRQASSLSTAASLRRSSACIFSAPSSRKSGLRAMRKGLHSTARRNGFSTLVTRPFDGAAVRRWPER